MDWLQLRLRDLFSLLTRSLFPASALFLILGSMWWGAWATLVLTFLWWRLVARAG